MIVRRVVMAGLGTACLARPLGLRAQPRARPARVGLLGNTRGGGGTGAPDLLPVFTAALRELGWVEGKNISYETRWAEQQLDRYPQLAAELLALDVDVIVSLAGATPTNAARRATATVPIVFIYAADPVRFGLVASLARPGANVTGIAAPPVTWGKYLELAHDLVPGATRVAVIANPQNQTYADYVAQNEAAAKRLGLTLQMIPVGRADELPNAFAAMKRERAAVLVFGPDGLYLSHVREIIERARAGRLPAIAPFLFAAELGALAAYGADARIGVHRAADYVDRILRGAKPAELPVEQPDRFTLILNLKTATVLSLAIPQSLLLRADQVIQ